MGANRVAAGYCMLLLAWVWSNHAMHGLAHGHEVALLEQAWSQGFGANSRFLPHPRADAFRGECLGTRVEFSYLECKGRTDCGNCACYVQSGTSASVVAGFSTIVCTL